MAQALQTKLQIINRSLKVQSVNLTETLNGEFKSKINTIKMLEQVISKLDGSIQLFPFEVKFSNKPIIKEVRKIRNSTIGIVQGLNDKVCKTKNVPKLLHPILKDLNIITSNIDTVLLDRYGTSPITSEDKMIPPRKKIVLHQLSDLNYNDFIEKMQQDIKELEKEEATPSYIAPSTPTVSNPVETKPIHDNPFSNESNPNFHEQDSKYNENADKNALQTQRVLQSLQHEVPSSIKLNKAGYVLVKAPVLAVTQNYIAETVLRKTGIKFVRLESGFNSGYNIGAKKIKETNNIFYTIFRQQILIAFPNSLLQNEKELAETKEIALRTLQRNIGKLISIPFGKSDNKRYYFSSERYPGFIFMWVMPEHIYNTVGQVKYYQVSIAVGAGNMKNDLSQETQKQGKPQDNPLIKQKQLREQEQDERLKRAADARQARNSVTNELTLQLDQIKKERKILRQNVVELKLESDRLTHGLAEQEQRLKKMVAGGPAYKAQISAITATKIAITQLQAKINSVNTEKTKELNTRATFLRGKIDEAVQNLIAQRKAAATEE